MKDLSGKVAFITGGASGIGLAMARAFGRRGMKVMLADIEAATLQSAVEDLRASQVTAEGVVVDVASRDQIRAGALETIARFGKVHVVCNNAGVGSGGAVGEVPAKDWEWVLDVNVLGVVNGVETFTPLMMSHGEGGHFVNTASMAGMVSPPGMEPYCASKFAVVAMSEGWAAQLQPKGIGMSVLCPGYVKTRIHESRRNRGAAYGADVRQPSFDSDLTSPVLSGMPVEPVGERVAEAVENDEFYIFTHPEFRGFVEERFQRILAAFDAAEQSQALKALPPRERPEIPH